MYLFCGNYYKKALHLSVNVFGTKVLIIGDTIFMFLSGDGTVIFCGHVSYMHEGLAVCRAKAKPPFPCYFKSLGISTAIGIEPPTLPSNALPTELILPWLIPACPWEMPFLAAVVESRIGPELHDRCILGQQPYQTFCYFYS